MGLLAEHQAAHLLQGSTARTVKDGATLQKVRDGSLALFSACEAKAQSGVDLGTALRESDASLHGDPSGIGVAATRSPVLLRLGHFRDAITACDAILTD